MPSMLPRCGPTLGSRKLSTTTAPKSRSPTLQVCCFVLRPLTLFWRADYFFDNVARLADEKYVPTYNDGMPAQFNAGLSVMLAVLHCWARTTGIVETMFQIKKDQFKLMDVGGQRNERKKWIHWCAGD